MNINKYPEIIPGHKFLKQFYISIMTWTIGKAFQVMYKLDKNVKAEFDRLPANFIMNLYILPDGAFKPFFYAKIMPDFVVNHGLLPLGMPMIIGKDKEGKLKYMGSDTRGKKITLKVGMKSIEEAFLVFCFRSPLAVAYNRGVYIVDGDLTESLAFSRAMEIVLVTLLPKFLAKLFVKRYPSWKELPPMKKWINRILLWIRVYTIG
jgi:hypothetical protein